jgi:hypothetical protein
MEIIKNFDSKVDLNQFMAVFIAMEYRVAGGGAPCVEVSPPHPELHPQWEPL